MTENSDLKDIAWRNARIIKELDPAVWREDVCGAYMKYDFYGDTNNMYGWHIDHIFPQSVLEDAGVPEYMINHSLNVRAMNIKNNLSKSDDYPRYHISYVYDRSIRKNVEANGIMRVSEDTQQKLRRLFGGYITNFSLGKLNQ